MKLLTQFSIPKPSMADLVRVNKNYKKDKKQIIDKLILFFIFRASIA